MNLLTIIHKNGIVSTTQIVGDYNDKDNKAHSQLIWNDQLNYYTIGLNSQEYEDIRQTCDICNFRAIYLNNILIVKNGGGLSKT